MADLGESIPRSAGVTASAAPAVRRRWGVNPIDLFFGPVFARDMQTLGRKKSTFVARACYLLILVGILSLVFFSFAMSSRVMGGAQRLQQMQAIAPTIAQVVLWFQFAAIVFLAPNLTAPCVCDEKRNRTLAALATSPITSAHIVFGSLTSRLVQLFIVAASVLPVLLALRAFGGLDLMMVLNATMVTFSAGVLAASLALLGSIYVRRASGAAGLAFLLMIFLSALPGIAAAVWYWTAAGSPPMWFLGPMLLASPPVAMAGAVTPAAPVPLTPTEISVYASGIYLGLSLLLCLYASAQLRRVMLREAAGEGGVAQPVRAKRSAAEPSAGTGKGPARRGTKRSRTVGDRPVMWREMRQAAITRRWWVNAIILAAVAAIMVWAYFETGLNEGMAFVPTLIALLLTVLQACTVASGAIAGEVQSKTWAVLLTTPMPPGEILMGKLVGAVVRLWPAPTLAMANLVFLTVMGALHPLALVHVGLVFAAVCVTLPSVGLLFSLTQRKGNAASTSTVLTMLGAWMVLPFLMMIASAVMSGFAGGRSRVQDVVGDVFLSFNPFYLIANALGGAFARPGSSFSLTYSLASGRVGWFEFSVYLLIGCAVMLAVATVARLLAGRLFPAWSIKGT